MTEVELEECCGNCKFSRLLGDETHRNYKDCFVCRINPPSPDILTAEAVWPIVSDHDWCSKFEPS